MKLLKYLFSFFKPKPTPEKPLNIKKEPIRWRPTDKYYF